MGPGATRDQQPASSAVAARQSMCFSLCRLQIAAAEANRSANLGSNPRHLCFAPPSSFVLPADLIPAGRRPSHDAWPYLYFSSRGTSPSRDACSLVPSPSSFTKSRSVPDCKCQMLSRLLPRHHHRRLLQTLSRAAAAAPDVDLHQRLCSSSAASSPSLSIWRRKKEMGKEGLMVVAQLKRLAALPPAGGHPRLEQFMRSHVSRLLRTDLLAVLAELLRQDHVSLSMKIYGVVRKEIWYRPDMYFYRDMLYMLARNKKINETRQVWADLKSEDVLFDQHTYGDIVRAFCDADLIDLAMEIYDDMRSSPDPPLSLPFRVILKGLVPYPELREKIKQDFLELFPDMIVYDPPDTLSDIDEEFKF
ncbi:uncharacterized protein [Zea mays]|uniref:uncharacterized protein isoform X1 n=1 Tax=Zea mays TaxID=4577 RepID=UPI0004DEC8A5|nr:uncharacterized protein LOC100217295 isoform X1 [Zea mays]|eukprot:XP_008672313.1 uncharacterized LOC100217295 isoform X2 [Zea mays]